MTSKTLLIISLFLVGCAGPRIEVPPEPVVISKFIYPSCDVPPKRAPIELRSLTWKVIGDRYTLSPAGYEDLSYNITVIWEAIKQLKTEIAYYQECLIEAKEDG